jgi:hypothetical protein
MAYTTIYMTNGIEVKKAPVGFSWTTFFFSGIPGLFRQDWIWAVAIIIAAVVTHGVAGVIAAFFYNKIYIKSLFGKGYYVHNLGGLTEDSLKTYLGYIHLPCKSNKNIL